MRTGFTLLEVLLASAIAVLLMAALYVAVDMQLHQVQVSRQLMERSALARNILNRIARDIRGSLAPTLPTSSGAAAASSSSSSGSTGSTGTSSGSSTGTGSTSSGSGSTSGGSSSGGSSGSTSSSSSSTSNAVTINIGVQGSTSMLVLSTSRLPPWAGRSSEQITANQSNPATDPTMASDLRYVIYWLASGGDSDQGLARQEITAVTASDALSTLPPGIPNESSYIIAEQVKSLSFSYFDGQNWQDSWDGTVLGPDGATPLGPPCAIAITLGIEAPGGQDNLQQYRHVVVLPTANGALLANGSPTNTTTSSSTATATNSSSNSSNSSSSQ